MCSEREQLVKDLEHWEDPSAQVLKHLPDQLPQPVGGNRMNPPKSPESVRKKFGNDTELPKSDFVLVLEACRLCDSSWVEPGSMDTSIEWLDLYCDQNLHVDTPHHQQWSDIAHSSSASKPSAYSDAFPTSGSLGTHKKYVLPCGESNGGSNEILSDAWPQSTMSTGDGFQPEISDFLEASCIGLTVSTDTDMISYERGSQRPNHEPQDVETVPGSGTRTPERRRNLLHKIRRVKTEGNLRGKSKKRAPDESYFDFD
jgi:hypothetical protein